MKQEEDSPTTTALLKADNSFSPSATPSCLRTSSRAIGRGRGKAKDSPPKPEVAANGLSPSTKATAKSVPRPRDIHIHILHNNNHSNNNCSQSQKTTRTTRRSLVLNKPKSGEDVAVGSQKGRESEEVESVARSGNHRPVVDQFSRPSPQRLTHPKISKSKGRGTRNEEGDDLDENNKELQEKLHQNEALIRNLQSEVLELKAELDKTQSLNLELHSHNIKLSEDLAAAETKIAALITHRDQMESVAEYQSPKFKDIQKLIANKLDHPKVKKETKTLSAAGAHTLPNTAYVQRKVLECPSTPPPPPPPPPRPPARAGAATSGKASSVVELYWPFAKCDEKKDSPVRGNYQKPIVSSAHSSIVGEIQNRSAHLLAIKSDIETKGEFINGLIQQVLAAAYTDIEDVLKFVYWLDGELSSLADERAVLKHFKWPEKKADALREAAIEYHSLKLLESEVSSYEDDTNIPCGVALKKMAGLLDKSERIMQRLIKLRNSVMLSYQDQKIPTDWMLDSGIVSKIKQASITLAKMYVKRVKVELESIQYSERESTQEALLLQGVHFAYRAHQFAGGLDSETWCAFEEIRQRVPGHLRGSQELLAGIPSS